MIASDHQYYFVQFPYCSISCCSAAAVPREAREHRAEHEQHCTHTHLLQIASISRKVLLCLTNEGNPGYITTKFVSTSFLCSDRSIPQRERAAGNYCLQSQLLARQDFKAAIQSAVRNKLLLLHKMTPIFTSK